MCLPVINRVVAKVLGTIYLWIDVYTHTQAWMAEFLSNTHLPLGKSLAETFDYFCEHPALAMVTQHKKEECQTFSIPALIQV